MTTPQTQTFYERTFTEEEQHMLTRALLAIRNNVHTSERDVIDGIIRDGWDRITITAAPPGFDGDTFAPEGEQLELPFDPNDVISVRFADREAWLEAHGYPQGDQS